MLFVRTKDVRRLDVSDDRNLSVSLGLDGITGISSAQIRNRMLTAGLKNIFSQRIKLGGLR